MTTAYDNVTALTVAAFTQMASSDQPAPGGGAVAGVVASLAAALAGMAGRFAEKEAPMPSAFSALVERADELRTQCCGVADADARAYTAFAAARRTPTDDGGARRRLAMRVARDAAAGPPLALAKAAREIADIGLVMVEGSPRLRSDACAAALFASAAATVSAILVNENISLDDSDARLAQANEYAAAAADAARRALAVVRPHDQALAP